MRSLGLIALLPCAACIAPAIGAGVVALAPFGAPAALGSSDKGQAQAEIGYSDVRGDPSKDVQGGWGLGVRSTGFVTFHGHDTLGVVMSGRIEAGAFGRDRIYGIDGATGGLGLRLGDHGYVGVGLGYEYGGYPQIGHDVLSRAQLALHRGGLGLRGSLHGAWRFGVRDEYPAATSRFGPGWNALGGDAVLSLTGELEGVGVGIGFDRQDDIRVTTVFIGSVLSKR